MPSPLDFIKKDTKSGSNPLDFIGKQDNASSDVQYQDYLKAFNAPDPVVSKAVEKTIQKAPEIKKKSFFSSDFLSNTNFFKEAAAGLDNFDNNIGVIALKKASSLVGGSSPENLPLGVGDVVQSGKQFINNQDPNLKEVTFGDWVTGMKEAGQGFVGQVISGGAELPSIATGGAYQPEISFNLPGIGEITNSDFKIAERVKNGEDPVRAVLSEKVNGFMNALFFIGIASKPFLRTTTVVGKGKLDSIDTKKGVVTAPRAKSFRPYSEPKFSTPLNQEIVNKIITDKGVTLKNYNPKLQTFFRMTGKTNGKIVGEIVQVKPSFVSRIFKNDTSKVPKEGVIVLDKKTADVARIENTKPDNVKVPVVPPVVKTPTTDVILPKQTQNKVDTTAKMVVEEVNIALDKGVPATEVADTLAIEMGVQPVEALSLVNDVVTKRNVNTTPVPQSVPDVSLSNAEIMSELKKVAEDVKKTGTQSIGDVFKTPDVTIPKEKPIVTEKPATKEDVKKIVADQKETPSQKAERVAAEKEAKALEVKPGEVIKIAKEATSFETFSEDLLKKFPEAGVYKVKKDPFTGKKKSTLVSIDFTQVGIPKNIIDIATFGKEVSIEDVFSLLKESKKPTLTKQEIADMKELRKKKDLKDKVIEKIQKDKVAMDAGKALAERIKKEEKTPSIIPITDEIMKTKNFVSENTKLQAKGEIQTYTEKGVTYDKKTGKLIPFEPRKKQIFRRDPFAGVPEGILSKIKRGKGYGLTNDDYTRLKQALMDNGYVNENTGLVVKSYGGEDVILGTTKTHEDGGFEYLVAGLNKNRTKIENVRIHATPITNDQILGRITTPLEKLTQKDKPRIETNLAKEEAKALKEIQKDVLSESPAKKLNIHFGRSSDTISQQLENAKGTPRARFIEDTVSELGYSTIEDAQNALDSYKIERNNASFQKTPTQMVSDMGGLTEAKPSTLKEQIDQFKALSEQHGVSIPFEVVDRIYTQDGGTAHGALFEHKVFFSKEGVLEDTGFHELLHEAMQTPKIFDVLKDVNMPEIIKAANGGKKPVNGYERNLAEEKIQQMAREYILKNNKKGIPKILVDFIEKLKILLTRIYRAFGGKIDVIKNFIRLMKYSRVKNTNRLEVTVNDSVYDKVLMDYVNGPKVLDFRNLPAQEAELRFLQIQAAIRRDYIKNKKSKEIVFGGSLKKMTEDLVLNDEKFKDNTFNITIDELVKDKEYYDAFDDVMNGKGAMTALPVLVKEVGKTGKFEIIDGSHRVAEALINGDNKIKGMSDESMYMKASEFIEKEELPSFQKKTTQQRNAINYTKFQGDMQAKAITLSMDLSNGAITKAEFDKKILAVWNRVKDTMTPEQKAFVFGRDLETKLQKKFYEASKDKGVSYQVNNNLPKFTIRPETKSDAVNRKIIEMNTRIKVMQEELTKQGVTIGEDVDVYLHKTLLKRRIGDQFRRSEQVKKDFVIKLQQDNLTIEEMDSYSRALYAPTYNKLMVERGTFEGDNASGITNKEAKDILDKFKDEGKIELLKKNRGILREIQQSSLALDIKNGLRTLDEVKGMMKIFGNDYVPQSRDMGDDGGVGGMVLGKKGVDVRGKENKRAKGSEREVLPVTAQIFNRYAQSFIRGEKNKVGQVLLKFIEENNQNGQMDGLFSVTKQEYIPRFDSNGELLYMDPKWMSEANIIGVKVSGKQYYIKIKDHRLATAIKETDVMG